MKVQVRNGDQLTYISRLFTLPLQLVSDANPEELQAGSEMLIPGFEKKKYKLKPFETFFSVAESLKVPVDTLFLLNRGKAVNRLGNGDEISFSKRVSERIVNGCRPYHYQALQEDIDKICNTYPFVKRIQIGSSVMGKKIEMLQIGQGNKKIHYNAVFHGNEWITAGILMTFIDDYCRALVNESKLQDIYMMKMYEETTLYAVPMVDPDGADLAINGLPDDNELQKLVLSMNENKTDFTGWKANIRGVDLNNQYPAKWEIEKERKPPVPGSRDYPGDYPLSEPEAQAIAEATFTYQFDRVIALHTQGKEFYWGFEGCEPEESMAIAEEFEKRSGYKSVRNLDSYAGFKDWFIYEFKRAGFTIELGEGINPLPLDQFDEIYEDTLGILLAGLYM